jgi:hypothetical protein
MNGAPARRLVRLAARVSDPRSFQMDAPPELLAPRPALSQRGLRVRFRPPGRCPAKGTRLLNLFSNDRSGSLGGGGNDPSGLRLAALLLAAEHVANACRCGRELIQLRSFDLTSASDTPVLHLDKQGLKSLRQAIDADSSGGGISTLTPGLDALRSAAEAFDGTVSLTIFSDYLLTDWPAVLPALEAFPADNIHAVVLTAPVPEQLVAHPKITVTHASWQDDPAIVAHAVHDQIVAHRRFKNPR